MKIAIVSDTHNNWPNFEKAINWIKGQGIGLILHCGDIQSKDIISQAKNLFAGEIKFVKGNADHDLQDLPEKTELKIDSKRIAFMHFPDEARKLVESGNFNIVFYGHKHKAWEEMVGNCKLVNPGELAGQFFKPTFAVYETSNNSLELKILEKI